MTTNEDRIDGKLWCEYCKAWVNTRTLIRDDGVFLVCAPCSIKALQHALWRKDLAKEEAERGGD